MSPIAWVPGELEEDIGQQRGGGVSTGEEDVDEFEAQGDGGANSFSEFVKKDVSAVWVRGGRAFLLSGSI